MFPQRSSHVGKAAAGGEVGRGGWRGGGGGGTRAWGREEGVQIEEENNAAWLAGAGRHG